MHSTVLEFCKNHIRAEDITGKRVLEVGALDVNGTVRPIVEAFKPKEYIGTDMMEGKGVDFVCDASNLVGRFGEESFDCVICTEVMEHLENWKISVSNIKRILKPGGFLFVTTRAPGFPPHDFPCDYWRYRMLDIKIIFGDLDLESLELDGWGPGIFMAARKPLMFSERDLSWFEVDGLESVKKCKELWGYWEYWK